MNNKHTPGPWKYEESTKTIRSVTENYWLATMDSWDSSVDHEANAKLIAAAPELLKALQNLVRVIHRENLHTTRGIKTATAITAITKATK